MGTKAGSLYRGWRDICGTIDYCFGIRKCQSRNACRSLDGRPRFAAVSPNDRRQLEAAQGWLELGDWNEANEELERITPQQRAHPDVLRMRVEVYSAAKKWDYVVEVASALCRMVPSEPFGFLRLAFALHELKRTREALNVLLPVADKFPEVWTIPYNLACYCCQLGDLIGARDWLAQAFGIGGAKEIKLQALEDPDLAPLWESPESTGN